MYKNKEGYNDPTAGTAVGRVDKIDKSILAQLNDLKKEREDIKRRICDIDAAIEKLEKEGCVSDSVACGKKGKKPLQTKKITGFPIPQYEQKLRYKKLYKNQLERQEEKIDRVVCKAEKYIQSISDSRIRRIVRYRHCDNLGWVQIAHRMGGKHTAESCRKAYERFIGF